jgi:hypothetical protein
MAAFTLAEAKAKLDEWKTAESKVAEGQAYIIAGRSMTRADLAAIAERIDYYSRLVNQLERSGGTGAIRIRTGVPI